MERWIKGDSESRRKRERTSIREKKKKKKVAAKTSSSSLLLLPYDLLVMIVARVPRSYYRPLSLVSKRFRSMVVSPELYKVRSLLGLTETCLYVCLRFGLMTSYKWYTLSSSSKTKSSGGYVLARLSMPPDDDHSPRVLGSCYSALVAVGSDIYNIAVSDKSMPPLGVSRFLIARLTCGVRDLAELSARVFDQKIYVVRRFHQDDDDASSPWKSSFQVFNTNTQTWDLPSCGGFDSSSIITFFIDGKFHVETFLHGVFAFNSKLCTWDLVEQYPSTDVMSSGSYCEVDNVLYSVCDDGALRWYDTDKTSWRDLKGLVGLPKLPSPLARYGSYVKLTGFGGGKLMVFWNSKFSCYLIKTETIYCAEIALERRNGDCWGKLEWFDTVLSVPLGTKFLKALAVTL